MLTKLHILANELDLAIQIADELDLTLQIAMESSYSFFELKKELVKIKDSLPNFTVMTTERLQAENFINGILNFHYSIPEAIEILSQVRNDFAEARKLIKL